MSTRPLRSEERALIESFAARLDAPRRQRLLDDLMVARAQTENADGSLISFAIDGYKHASPPGRCPFNIEGRMLDSDGADLTVLLHADELGHLLEIEFVRWGEGDLLGPRWETLRLC